MSEIRLVGKFENGKWTTHLSLNVQAVHRFMYCKLIKKLGIVHDYTIILVILIGYCKYITLSPKCW